MDILNTAINCLTKDEIRYFKVFAQRMVSDTKRKDLQLFDYIRKSGESYNEELIHKKLYKEADKAVLYRLKNRLLDDLGDYLTYHYLHKNAVGELSRFLSLYSIFIDKGKHKVALFYLKKAEKLATQAENFEMLDIIYGNFIKLSNDLIEVNPEDYIAKWKGNTLKLNRVREADQALAALSYRLKKTQNLTGDQTNALKILKNTIKEFAVDTSVKHSRTFQTRIYRAVSQVLLQKHDYVELEKFLKETYGQFVTAGWFGKENHELKLQMLTYLINSLFRNAKYAESLKHAEELGNEISAFNGILYNKFLFFYYNSLVINYTATNKAKALSILESFEKEIKNKTNSYYDQFLYFNKAMLLHQLGKPSEAIKNIVKLYVNDNYKSAADAFKLKIAVAELIMHFDTGDSDTYFLRSKSIKQQFKITLTEGDFNREWQLVSIMDEMISTPIYRRNTKLRSKCEAFIKAKIPAKAQDAEIIKYAVWLSSKWE